MKKIRKAVIPAAGFGTRFLPITKIIPKELLPIGNKPAIQYVVQECVEAGLEEIILVCHPDKTSIADYFTPNKSLHTFLKSRGKFQESQELKQIESLANFKVVYQKEPLGLGHAIGCARKAIGDEPFVVLLPDMILPPEQTGLTEMVQLFQKTGSWGLLLMPVSKEKTSSYGIVKGQKDKKGIFWIQSAVEKPQPQDAPSNLAILGRYLFPPEIFEYIQRSEKGALGEIQVTDAINSLLKKKRGWGIVRKGGIFDVGVPAGLRHASSILL